MPEAWTLQLLPRSGVELAATLVPTVLAMGNLAVAALFGIPALSILASFFYLASLWLAVVAPVQAVVDDLTGATPPALADRLARLGESFLWSIPLALVQDTGFCLVAGLVNRGLGLRLAGPMGIVVLASLLWFHTASLLTLVRRRLRPDESWLYSFLAGHGQVLRFFPLGLIDVARDWARRSQLALGSFPGVPGQGTVHSRVGMAWGLDVAVGALTIASVSAAARFLGPTTVVQLVAVVLGSGLLSLGAYVTGMNLAHAYAGYLSLAGGHLDAWLEAGASPQALPSGTDDPPPAPGLDPSGAAGSAAG